MFRGLQRSRWLKRCDCVWKDVFFQHFPHAEGEHHGGMSLPACMRVFMASHHVVIQYWAMSMQLDWLPLHICGSSYDKYSQNMHLLPDSFFSLCIHHGFPPVCTTSPPTLPFDVALLGLSPPAWRCETSVIFMDLSSHRLRKTVFFAYSSLTTPMINISIVISQIAGHVSYMVICIGVHGYTGWRSYAFFSSSEVFFFYPLWIIF